MNNKFRFEKISANIILLFGVILVLFQLLYNRSLWGDEPKLALNIINKSYLELFQPLDNGQVAPILFLQIEKIFTTIIPNSEIGLRVFPFLSYICSLFLFYKILKLIHRNYYTISFALTLFVLNATLIYYSSEVKQYMSDVLVLVLTYYVVLRKYTKEYLMYIYFGMIGVLNIFLSNVSPIILSTVAIYLLYIYFKRGENIKSISKLFLVFIVWFLVFVLYYFQFIYNHPLKNFMLSFWDNAGAFMPLNPLDISFYTFFLNKIVSIIHMNGVIAVLPTFSRLIIDINFVDIMIICLLIIGIYQLIIKKRIDIIILSFSPFLIQLTLSCIKLYPFDTRLILYTIPCVIIICSFGFNYLINILFIDLKVDRIRFIPILIFLFLFLFFYNQGGFPIKNIEMKKSILFVKKFSNKEDKVFISSLLNMPYLYYKEKLFNDIPNEIIINEDRSKYDTSYFNQNQKLLNGRVWFVLDNSNYELMDDFNYYFNIRNEKIIKEFNTHGSSAYLINFNVNE